MQYIPGVGVPAVAALAWSVVFTRVFSEAEYGRYGIVAATAGLGALLGYRWLEQSIIRYVPRDPTHRDGHALEQAIVLGMFAVSAIVVSLLPFTYLFSPEWRPLVAGGLVLTAASGVGTPLLAMLTVRMKSRTYSTLRALESITRLLLPVVAVLSFRQDVSMLVWGAAVSHVLILVPLAKSVHLPRFRLVVRKRREVAGFLRRFVEYGLPLSVWFVFANLLTVGDRYIIQWFRGATEVGVYTANYQLIQGSVILALTPVVLAVNPRLMQSWESGDRQKAIKSLEDIIPTLIVVGIAAVGIIDVLAPYLASVLLGEGFRSGYRVMPVVLLGLVTWRVSSFVQKPLEFVERTREMVIYVLIAAVVNIAANLLFVPRFGYNAAAWTTTLSYGVYAILVYQGARRVGGPELRLGKIARPALTTVALAAFHRVVSAEYVTDSGWARVTFAALTVIGIATGVYVSWRHEITKRMIRVGPPEG